MEAIETSSNKKSNNSKSIEISVLLNPLYKSSKYQTSSDKENIEALKEKMKKENEYSIKEHILYNNIPNDYILNSNSDTTNTYYFQNFIELKDDFDYTNFMNLINIRQNYLKSVFEENVDEKKKENDKKEKENKEEEKKDKESNEKDKDKDKENKDNKENVKIDIEELKKKDTLYSLFSDLTDMFNSQEQEDSFLYYSIIDRIFSNIFFEIETFFDEKDLIRHSLYETQLCESIDKFEKNLLSKEENINNNIIHFLYQLQKLSLSIKSCGAFLKILKLMKSKNIAFDNYNSIYDNYFKFNLTNLMKKKSKDNNDIKKQKIFDISLNIEISSFEFCIDDKYLFLTHDYNKKNYFKLEKYLISTGEKIFEKEINYYFNISMLNDYKNNRLDILVYKHENEFELLIIDKNDFSIEKKITIFSPIEKTEFSQLVTSLSFFYLISEKQIYCLDVSDLNKSLFFTEYITLKQKLKKDLSYYFFLDEYIEFNSLNKINLENKTIEEVHDENTKENERNYYDNFNNLLYSLKYIKGKKIIEINRRSLGNFYLRIFNLNDELNEINNNTDKSLAILTKDYPTKSNFSKNTEKSKIAPFKHYLDYSNNLDSIFNIDDIKLDDKENKYKISKELSENYYYFLYYSMIKYYHYYDGNTTSNKLLININNDIMFDIVKQMATNEKDYILLYIYTYFITKEKNKDTNEKNR